MTTVTAHCRQIPQNRARSYAAASDIASLTRPLMAANARPRPKPRSAIAAIPSIEDVSLRLPGLAAKQRLGVALEVVREHAHCAGSAAHLVERNAQLVREARIRRDDLVGGVERTLRGGQRGSDPDDCLRQLHADLLDRH